MFAQNYIENSNNVENFRGKPKEGIKIDRISVERVCAGPAVPLIYEFYKTKEKDLERILETGENAKDPDQITSSDIVKAAFRHEEGGVTKPDPLCRKVIEKFAEILAVEVGNHALKTLPYGGIFLIGGVTIGISELI